MKSLYLVLLLSFFYVPATSCVFTGPQPEMNEEVTKAPKKRKKRKKKKRAKKTKMKSKAPAVAKNSGDADEFAGAQEDSGTPGVAERSETLSQLGCYDNVGFGSRIDGLMMCKKLSVSASGQRFKMLLLPNGKEKFLTKKQIRRIAKPTKAPPIGSKIFVSCETEGISSICYGDRSCQKTEKCLFECKTIDSAGDKVYAICKKKEYTIDLDSFYVAK